MKMPLNIGRIHFIGIGGIGMSGIAEALHILGYKVQGSDMSDNANIKRLKKMGVKIFIGHDTKYVDNAEVVVISTAISADNVELKAARLKRIPVVRRAEMLAELMRFRQSISVGGTHGKTTTTSLIASLLQFGGFDPTVINGGVINFYGTNAYIGKGKWMVVEADESDGSFLKLPSDVVVVTNMDPEHLDYYGTYETMIDAYQEFVERIPFYGLAVLCADHPQVLAMSKRIEDRRIITYGEHPESDVFYSNARVRDGLSVFDITIRPRKKSGVIELKELQFPIPGKHNISNATAAVAVAYTLGVSPKNIRKALRTFSGVKRRFTKTGTYNGVVVYDDYAHHPVEIQSVLRAARETCSGRVIAVSQPHRYSRLANLMSDFSKCYMDADKIFITPVYAAGEDPIENISSEHLVEKIKKTGHQDVSIVSDFDELVRTLSTFIREGDFIICLGAGTITHWAYRLPERLSEMS